MSEPDGSQHRDAPPPMPSHVPAGTDGASGSVRRYVRYAALGDSATLGVGDRWGDGWRGWARLLADALAEHHDVSFCNLGATGATAAVVRRDQLEDAVAHRPHLASLVVGLNDTMRSTWDPDEVRDDLLHCAGRLSDAGAVLLTARFHDHSRVFRLPGVLARPMTRRIDALNAIYDEVHSTYGGLRLDLGEGGDIYTRAFWSIDRLHPSPLGHQLLATKAARLLNQQGLAFSGPEVSCTGESAWKLSDAWPLLKDAGPWLGRRARDLGPWAVRRFVARIPGPWPAPAPSSSSPSGALPST